MNNKEPKLVRIPLKTEHEFYEKDITILGIAGIVFTLIVAAIFLNCVYFNSSCNIFNRINPLIRIAKIRLSF